jgi:aminocarboxymuconate-semialdehyde decarboxylase
MSVVDVHAHYVAPALRDEIERGAYAPHLQLTQTASGTCCQFPTGPSRPFFERMLDLDARLRRMDELGVDVQVLSTWVDLLGYDLPAEVAEAYHRQVNEGLARAVEARPDRFRFLASVPLPWGERAAAVLEDAVRRLGALGSMIGTNMVGVGLDDPGLEPFWTRSVALGAPVELHPVNVAAQDRLRQYYLQNLLGNPFDTTIAASSLVLGGVLDRHPRLAVILLHGGGYFPYAVGRLDHGFDVRSETHTSQQPPSTYLRRFYYDVLVYRPAIMQALGELVGVDHLFLGTDYPFDMEPPDAVAMVRAVFGEQAPAVLGSNVAQLLGAVFGETGKDT